MIKLRIAIQKKGRLNEDSIRLLKECGISIDNGKDQLKANARNFPIEVLYLRNADIPKYVEDGVADIAIVGDNLLVEKESSVREVLPLGFSKCKVSLAIPKEVKYEGLSWFSGKKIATSYPKTVSKYLAENNIKASVHVISGSVEIAPNIGLADGICDIVSSGSTLFKNGLKEVEEIMKSQAVLIANQSLDDERTAILEKLVFRIKAVLASKNNKYILLNAPNDKITEITRLLPGMKSPTVLPLAKEGWSSMHSVINENDFWEVIDQLQLVGAEGILIVPIEKMVV
ncbi:MAG: ATP phosphoribosyltransferase [Flavobacteriales bacterium]|nr:ATP phosphoribosyltransferase [Flavobacteriales bacterium]